MTEQNAEDPTTELARKIIKRLDEFKIHLISYQGKVRRALTEEPVKHRHTLFREQ